MARNLHRVVLWQDVYGFHTVCSCGWAFDHRWSLSAVRMAQFCHTSPAVNVA